MRAWPKRTVLLHGFAAVSLGLTCALLLAVVRGPWMALAGVAVAVGYWALSTRRYRKRRKLLRQPIPPQVRETLDREVSFYRALSGERRRRFEDDVRIFMAEQQIGGLSGREVADNVKVLIAASAAMLTNGLPDWEWPRVRDIVVYPRAFDDEYNADAEGDISGMVHLQGPVLFSQRHLKHGFTKPSDGHNVGLHELAHVMDMADGYADGVPGSLPWVSSAPWIELMAERLQRIRRRSGGRVLRDYAGTNEAELFAVAVEVFFEQPHRLQRRDPELFDMLRSYFNIDPRELNERDQTNDRN